MDFHHLTADTQADLVGYGITNQDEIAKQKKAAEQLTSEIALEWPTDRLKQSILDFLRERASWSILERNKSEITNEEERRKGVSYKNRQKHVARIRAAEALRDHCKRVGVMYSKRGTIAATEFFTDADLDYIRAVGFEHHLKGRLLFSEL